MTLVHVDGPVRELLREAAEWRLLGLLFECPADGWREELAALAAESGDASLREAVHLAHREASPQLYHTTFGPGGPAPPREVSYRRTLHPGRFLAELRACYEAFAYAPRTEETPDHVATEAGFVAYLRLKEAYAASSSDAELAAVCRAASERFVEENLSVLSQPLARRLTSSPVGYLALASAGLLERVGPPRNPSPSGANGLGTVPIFAQRKWDCPLPKSDLAGGECLCGPPQQDFQDTE